MENAHPRQETQLDRLMSYRIGAGNDCLAGNDGRQRCHSEQRHGQRGRDHPEERIVDELGVLDQHRRLAQIIEDQRGHDDVQPCRCDRLSPEMPHVGVKRFRAGDCVHDRSQRQE